jgi:hypothetical protein
MKIEFVSTATKPAFFIVSEQFTQAFINHLKCKNVYVHPPRHYLTDNGTEYFALEIQSGIPPQDGNQLVATFKPLPQKNQKGL